MGLWEQYKPQVVMVAKSQVLSKVEKGRLLKQFKREKMKTKEDVRKFNRWLTDVAQYYILKEDYMALKRR